MCIRPPCENCGANYDACYAACPQCGHPNGTRGAVFPYFDTFSANITFSGNIKEKREKVYCKICKCDHEVVRLEVT